MAVTETTDAYLFLQVAEHDRVIIKYNTDDCGPVCEAFTEIFDAYAGMPEYKEIIFLTINAENNPVAKKHILNKKQPVVALYFKGQLLDSRHASNREGLDELISILLSR